MKIYAFKLLFIIVLTATIGGGQNQRTAKTF